VRAAAWRSGWAPGSAPAEQPSTPCAGAYGYVQATTCQSWSRSRPRTHPLRWRRGTHRVDERRTARPRHHRREVSSPTRNVGARRSVTRSHELSARDAPVPRPCSSRSATTRAPFVLDAHAHAIRILARAWCRVRWTCWQKREAYDSRRVRADRQRGACRGASEADGSGAATVTRIGKLWPARTRKRPRKASTIVRRARSPAPIRFARPRRAPRVRALPAPTRGPGTARGQIQSAIARPSAFEPG
jgi:hypothetical protein